MITPRHWFEEVEGLAAAGARFLGLYAAGGEGRPLRVTVALEHNGLKRSLTCDAGDRKVPSLVGVFPAAAWDEREAHDLYGVTFGGHEPLRPLVNHVDDPEAWMTPVVGDAVHQVAVGPVHAGVIESGHFRFHLVGERILALDLRLFYKHRGLEKMAEGRDADGSRQVMALTCASSSVAIQVALAQCWEEHLGLQPGPELRRARTLLIELERLYNHLNDIGAICAGVGFSPGAMAFGALKERVQKLNYRLTGHRFLFSTVEVGGSKLVIDEAQATDTEAEVASIAADSAALWRELLFAASVQDRLRGTGVVDRALAVQLGLVGPVARASGVLTDRRCRPATNLAYPDDFQLASLELPTGDVAARTEIRAVEVQQSCALLAELAAGPLDAAAASAVETDSPRPGNPGEPTLATVEGPRGEILCALEVDQGRVARIHLRTASFANWPAITHAVIGDILPDFPLINKSFELSYAAVDR